METQGLSEEQTLRIGLIPGWLRVQYCEAGFKAVEKMMKEC